MSQIPFILCIDSRVENPTSLYARFQIGPIPEGHGLTIGNVLRRVLLSDLKTLSIVAAKIQLGNGTLVPHEYSSLPGVRESTLDLLLNLRQIVLQSEKDFEEPILGFLNVVGPTVIRAKDIKFSEDVYLVDPEQYIGTLNEEGSLSIQLIASYGKKGKSFLKIDPSELGLFLLNAPFNPVHQVNYKIESSYNTTNSEQLILEVKTNGSVHPTQALKLSLQKTQNLFNSLIFNPLQNFQDDELSNERKKSPYNQFDSKTEYQNFLGNKITFTASLKKRLCSLDIANFNFDLNTFAFLKTQNIHTIGDLIFADLNAFEKTLSKQSILEIKKILDQFGFQDQQKIN
jgi:DNA-directed RNA polymerase subunit alpha